MKVIKRPPKGKSGRARASGQRVGERPTRRKSPEKTGEGQEQGGFLFQDPYWDDIFCSYYDPTLGTCCR